MLIAWIALLIYVAITLAIGWYSYTKQQTEADHWTAGRKLSPLSVGLSLSAGFMSVSWSCVYAVQLFYWYGIGAFWIITFPWLIALWMIYKLSGKYHQLTAFSQPEMVGGRFGSSARKAVALALAFVFLVWGGAEIYVAANLLSPELGISLNWVIVIISVVVGIYMTFGGFRAVVTTDKLQFVLVALYILFVAGLAWTGLSQSGGTLPDIATTGAKSGVSWVALFSPGIMIILLTLVAYLPGWIFEADLWLRVQAAESPRAARKGVIIGAVNGFLFVGIIPMFIGIAALKLYPMTAGAFPAHIGFEGDAIFATLAADYAPAWLKLILTLGLVAAAMSTIDTCLNVMGLSIAYDFSHDKPISQKTGFSKAVTALTVVVAMLFSMSINSLWDIFYLSSGILTTAVAFPVAAVFMKHASRRGVFLSSVFGFVGTVAAYYGETRGFLDRIEPAWLIESYLGYILWGLGFAIIGYWIGKWTDTESVDSLNNNNGEETS